MGPLGFLFVAVGGLMVYSGFTGQPLVSTVATIFKGGTPAEGGTPAKGSTPAEGGSGYTGGGGEF